MTQNEISHYESLKKQDTANRKLIKKLQLDKQALKEQLILSGVVKSFTTDEVLNVLDSSYELIDAISFFEYYKK